jgi:hypothetical protein
MGTCVKFIKLSIFYIVKVAHRMFPVHQHLLREMKSPTTSVPIMSATLWHNLPLHKSRLLKAPFSDSVYTNTDIVFDLVWISGLESLLLM